MGSLPASIASTASESSISTVGSSSTAHRRTKSLESTTKRRHNVRFAPSPHVRTYSLVLGDHPPRRRPGHRAGMGLQRGGSNRGNIVSRGWKHHQVRLRAKVLPVAKAVAPGRGRVHRRGTRRAQARFGNGGTEQTRGRFLPPSPRDVETPSREVATRGAERTHGVVRRSAQTKQPTNKTNTQNELAN